MSLHVQTEELLHHENRGISFFSRMLHKEITLLVFFKRVNNKNFYPKLIMQASWDTNVPDIMVVHI